MRSIECLKCQLRDGGRERLRAARSSWGSNWQSDLLNPAGGSAFANIRELGVNLTLNRRQFGRACVLCASCQRIPGVATVGDRIASRAFATGAVTLPR